MSSKDIRGLASSWGNFPFGGADETVEVTEVRRKAVVKNTWVSNGPLIAGSCQSGSHCHRRGHGPFRGRMPHDDVRVGRLNVSNEMQMNCCQPFDRGRRNHRPGRDITSSEMIAARELVWGWSRLSHLFVTPLKAGAVNPNAMKENRSHGLLTFSPASRTRRSPGWSNCFHGIGHSRR